MSRREIQKNELLYNLTDENLVLSSKIERLKNFLNSNPEQFVREKQVELMQKQLKAMENYKFFLCCRIADLALSDCETSDNTDCVPDDNEYGFTHDFSWALRMMKKGCRIHRSGWNGKGMFAVLQKGYPNGIPCNKQTAEAWGINEGDLFRCEPYMQLKMVNGSHSMWVPSVNDCLSNDWAITK